MSAEDERRPPTSRPKEEDASRQHVLDNANLLEDSEDEDTEKDAFAGSTSSSSATSTRESIRKKLAAQDKEYSLENNDGLSGRNLLVCFMNDTPSDDDWESEDSCTTNAKSIAPTTGAQSRPVERVSAKSLLVKGNISRKKGHVIIPLRCSSEAANDDLNSVVSHSPVNSPDVTTENQEERNLENAFFDQLANIQADARRKLRDAKTMAVKTLDAERCERRTNNEIVKLLGIPLQPAHPNSKVKSHPGQRKLNRRVLTQMNVGQLQVILNYLLSQIETLNENLVQFLISRDELAIEQDSLLTDVEDITKCISGVSSVMSPL